MGYSNFKKLLYLIVNVDEMLVLFFFFFVLHTAVSADFLLFLCLGVSVYLYTQCCLLLTRIAIFPFKSLIHSLLHITLIS